MALYTVLGGKGFIGNEVVKQLHARGDKVFVPEKEDTTILERELGTVIYCIGHGDCANNPFKVLDANIVLLSRLLEKAKFEKLIYISSTRVYMNQTCSFEQSDLTISANDGRRLFNLTKLTAEEMCLKSGRSICIVRPSNVYGLALSSPLFLPAITRDAINRGEINMYVDPSYEKDYVSVLDVAEIVVKISTKMKFESEIYNVASGLNVSAKQIADVLRKETGCKVNWHGCNNEEVFPIVPISKIQKEFGFIPRNVLDDLKSMVNDFKKVL
ncbi:SDR family oxidoreductase [Shewanella algae]|uniref:NAD-dependent epimerase/dehydratase family protein n=1 Tax=Shewanella algae TaxID=38313 RepID=UPI0031F52DD3